MFGGIGISTYQAKSALMAGLSKGSTLENIAGGLLNQALGIDTAVNTVNFFIADQQTGTNLQLPVNPEKVKMKWDRKIETVNILNIGEVDFTTGDKLQEISFSSFFPAEYVPTYCITADLPMPSSANSVMSAWKSRFAYPIKGLADPIQLIITGVQDINMNCIMSSYSSDEHGGEPGDVYYEVSFREWRTIAVRKESEEKTTSRVNLKPRPKLVKIPASTGLFGSQEALWKVAKQHYGDGSSWNKIVSANAGGILNEAVLP